LLLLIIITQEIFVKNTKILFAALCVTLAAQSVQAMRSTATQVASKKFAFNIPQRTFFGALPKATWGDKIHRLNEKLPWSRVLGFAAGTSFASLVYIYQEQKLMDKKAEVNALKKELAQKKS
jgi:hypothetical protein